MAVTKYIVSTFNRELAAGGSLCAMVKTSVTNGSEVSTAPETGVSQPTLMGVGICRVVSDRYHLTINNILYVFKWQGQSDSGNTSGYKLMMAETKDKASEIGNAVETSVTTTITRAVDGSISSTEEVEDSSVIVSSLEARDQFAMHALRTLMQRMDRDPASVSDNEKMFVCEAAYQWAANMMTQASKVRAYIDTAAGGGTAATDNITRGMEVDNSEINTVTDKLLNNIIAALEKTDEKETVTEGQTPITRYYERISIPRLMTWLNAYSHHTPTEAGDTQTTVGLDDLIKAIKGISSGGGSTTVDFTALITALNSTQTVGIRGTMPDVNVGNGGLGRDANHPIYINMSGSGGSTVSYVPAVTSGTLLGTIVINGTNNYIHAPSGGSSVSYTQVVTAGERIGTITINGTDSGIFVPNLYVTLNDDQTVPGTKTFTNGLNIKVSALKLLNNSDSTVGEMKFGSFTHNNVSYNALQIRGENIVIKNSTSSGKIFLDSEKPIEAYGYKHPDFDDNYVLLAGGGTKAISSFPGGGGGSVVSYSPILTTGTDIGTLTIDGTPYTLKAPSGGSGGGDMTTDTDQNVTGTKTFNAAQRMGAVNTTSSYALYFDTTITSTSYIRITSVPRTKADGTTEYASMLVLYCSNGVKSTSSVPLEATGGFRKTGKTDDEILLAGGGTASHEDYVHKDSFLDLIRQIGLLTGKEGAAIYNTTAKEYKYNFFSEFSKAAFDAKNDGSYYCCLDDVVIDDVTLTRPIVLFIKSGTSITIQCVVDSSDYLLTWTTEGAIRSTRTRMEGLYDVGFDLVSYASGLLEDYGYSASVITESSTIDTVSNLKSLRMYAYLLDA